VTQGTSVDRRTTPRADRRKNSRNGRRGTDPRSNNWRRAAWLFGVYAVYLSVRSLPATFRRLWRRNTA